MEFSRALPLFLLYWLCSQGCESKPAVVHIIAHSHCDPGYRKTFAAYYTTEVKSIISTVLKALLEAPDRRFVWEEVSFFSFWWEQASKEDRLLIKQLVVSGQLEFIGGGWVMHDEAVTSAFGVLNQMSLGLKFLNESLGVRPHVEWHIDPFGHSIFMPELYSLLGYKAVIINRIPNCIKQEMKKRKTLEFFWRSPFSNQTIFTHVLDSHYSTPYIPDFPTVEERAAFFVNQVKKRLQWYRTENILIPFGSDFSFQNAVDDFKKMDEIVEYLAGHQDLFNLTAKYSTLSEYVDAVLSSGVNYNVHNGDFFPYISCYPCFASECGGLWGLLEGNPCGPEALSDSYWSGFYTSKPAQKLLVREQEASLKALEVLNTMFPYLVHNISVELQLGRNTSALLQHHDAITGTSFPDCYEDYNKRLEDALEAGNSSIALLKSVLLCGVGQPATLTSDSVLVLSSLNGTNSAVVIIQNPLETERYTYVTIALPHGLCVQVQTASLSVLESQQVGSEVYIPVLLPAFGVEVILLKKTKCNKTSPLKEKGLAAFSLSNGALKLDFDSTNHLRGWEVLGTNRTHTVGHSYIQYRERRGLYPWDNVCDGTNVYTFVPDDGKEILTPEGHYTRKTCLLSFNPCHKHEPFPAPLCTPGVALAEAASEILASFPGSPYHSVHRESLGTWLIIPTKITANGPLIWEVEQQINSYITASIRLYKPLYNNGTSQNVYTKFVQWQTKIGPLPSDTPNSVSSVLATDLNNGNKFITYTNGFYPMERIYDLQLPLQGNTYPLVGRSYFTDNITSLAVITQRPVGMTSYNGTMEITLHRRIKLPFYDDDTRGDDDSVLDDSVLIAFLENSTVSAVTATAMAEFQSPPTLHFALLNSSSQWTKHCKTSWAPGNTAIPPGVHLVQMRVVEPYNSTTQETQVGIGVINANENTPQSFDLNRGLFAEGKVLMVRETTPDFQVNIGKDPCHTQVNEDSCKITLEPLRLRSFFLTILLCKQ